MTIRRWWAAGLALTCAAGLARAQIPATVFVGQEGEKSPVVEAERPVEPTASRVTAVTVYQGNALVTRTVEVPEGKGLVEVVVTPLPAETIDSSLYTEGTDGLRVLSTRYRMRAVKEDTRAGVRAKQQLIAKLRQEAERLQKEAQVHEQNIQLLGKLENFTGATLQQLAEKGRLDSEATIGLAKYVMDSRATESAKQVEIQQTFRANAEATDLTTRELNQLSAGASKTQRDAVIVVDKEDPKAGQVRLNYLVGAATWHPQYRFHAGSEKDPINLEYLAAVEQKTGEDWTGVDITLSTAQPQLNATPPDLLALDIAVVGRGGMMAGRPPGQPGHQRPGMAGAGGMGMMNGTSMAAADELRAQSRSLREQAQKQMISNNAEAGGAIINQAAALEQTEELFAKAKDDRDDQKLGGNQGRQAAPPETATVHREGPSVTYHLRARLTVPSRNDQQLIEVARIELKPHYYAKAVPVLTPHVYRLADLVNGSRYVLLPGEATMYIGSDFVGRMNLPLVAIGERLAVGFGVDPQLQVARQLVRKQRNVQGGNQVHTYEYRITVSSYKAEPVRMQVWDRLPRAEAEAVAVSLEEPKPKLSADPTYARKDRPENLLRWDLAVEPGTSGEKAATIDYQFKLEYARDVSIASLKPKSSDRGATVDTLPPPAATPPAPPAPPQP
jgi:Domain of unknown function (DUF4139)/N-terminal domain of unknown function (DUF4140)